MNIRELIKKLQEFDPRLIVTERGYEGGITEEFSVHLQAIIPDSNRGCDYYGEHEEAYPSDPSEDKKMVVLIDRWGKSDD